MFKKNHLAFQAGLLFKKQMLGGVFKPLVCSDQHRFWSDCADSYLLLSMSYS